MPQELDSKVEKALPEAALPTQQVEEAVRFSLRTLLSITEKINELDPQKKEASHPNSIANNVLDPAYSRPWWTIILGLGGLYLGYRLLGKEQENDN